MNRTGWRRHAAVVVALSLIPALVAAQGVKEPHQPLSTTIGDITSLRSSYVEAWNSHDSKALAAFYLPDAAVINPNGARLVGAAIGKYFADSAASLGQLELTSHGIKVYGTMAVDMGTASVRQAGGAAQMTEYLAVLRHDVKGWHVQYLANVPKAGM